MKNNLTIYRKRILRFILFLIICTFLYKIFYFTSDQVNFLNKYQNVWNITYIKCYIISNLLRDPITSYNCSYIFVTQTKIIIESDKIYHRNCNEYNSKCYIYDYLAILEHFKYKNDHHFVLLEDDALMCNKTMSYITNCYNKKHNCKLGTGSTFNFYYNYQNINLKNETLIKEHNHIDWYMRDLRIFHEAEKVVNHLGKYSVMGHKNGILYFC
jgi:hypothetical protein